MKMKTNKTHILGFILLCITIFLFVPELLSAQDLSTAEGEVTKQLTAGRRIIKGVVDFMFALGAIGVIWAFVSKRDDAKNWLIAYFVAIIVWGVIRTMFFTGI